MQKTWVPEFTPSLQKFTKIYATFCAIYKNLRNLQCKLDLAPGPTPTFNRLVAASPHNPPRHTETASFGLCLTGHAAHGATPSRSECGVRRGGRCPTRAPRSDAAVALGLGGWAVDAGGGGPAHSRSPEAGVARAVVPQGVGVGRVRRVHRGRFEAGDDGQTVGARGVGQRDVYGT